MDTTNVEHAIQRLADDYGANLQTIAKYVESSQREIADLKARLLTAAGDDLCRLSQEEIKAMGLGSVQIPPKEEFLASCSRFHDQVAGEVGVNHGCLTLAQLIAENQKLKEQLESCLSGKVV